MTISLGRPSAEAGMEGGCLEAFLAPTGRGEGVAVPPAVGGGGWDVARPALCGAAPAPSEPGLRGPRRQQRARETLLYKRRKNVASPLHKGKTKQ